MSDLVPASDIERIVGADRHPTDHLGRAVSAEQTVYVLHSQACLDSGVDLRDCAYSVALDRGIDTRVWVQDRPVRLAIFDGELMPDISAMLLGSDADPSPAHIEAVARVIAALLAEVERLGTIVEPMTERLLAALREKPRTTFAAALDEWRRSASPEVPSDLDTALLAREGGA